MEVIAPTPTENPPLEVTQGGKPLDLSIETTLQRARKTNRDLIGASNRLHKARDRFKQLRGGDPYSKEVEQDASLSSFVAEYNRDLATLNAEVLGLAENLTTPISGLENTPIRKVRGRLNTPMCDEVSWGLGSYKPADVDRLFPILGRGEYTRHYADMGFNTAFIPWRPAQVDRDFYYEHPEEIVRMEHSSLDQYVRDIIEPMLPRSGILSFDIWLNWCLSKKILGVEMFAADARSNEVSALLRRVRGPDGKVKPYPSHTADEEAFTYIPTPEELLEKRAKVKQGVKGWYEGNISDAFSLVSLARWDVEENLELYGDNLSSLPSMYRDFLAALEFSYPSNYRADYANFSIAQSYATLVMGGRQEQYYHGAFLTPHELVLDYFDALMLLSAELDLNMQDYFSQGEIAEKKLPFYAPPRCLFGDHDTMNTKVDGIVLTMATMYFRMDEEQKRRYAPIIRRVFKNATQNRFFTGTGCTAALARVPGTNANQEPEDERDIAPALSTAQDWQRKVVYGLISGGHRLHHGMRQIKDFRPRYRIHAISYNWNKDQHVPNSIEGHQADRLEVNSEGYLVLKKDGGEMRPEDIPVALTVLERRGEVVAGKVEKILHRPEDGDLDRLAQIRTMMEMVTGFKLPDDDLYHILMWLGGVQNQAGVIKDATREEIGRILEGCHNMPDFESSDRLSQLMAIYATFGFLPKEMVVERILSSAEAAGSLFTVRFALMLENMRKQDLESRGLDVSGYVSPIFTARDEILQAKAKYDKKEITFDRYRVIVEHSLAAILEHFNAYCQYDWTMGSALTSMLVAEKTGSLYAQCSAQAEIMADFANFVSPEPCAYPSFREVDTDIPLDKWYLRIRSGHSVSHDHLMAQADFGFGDNLRVYIMDQNSGHLLLAGKVETDQERSGVTFNTRVDKYPRLRRPELSDTPFWTAINYGAKYKGRTSPMLAHLAKDFPLLLRYAHLFNPDDILMLWSFAGDDKLPLTERLDAFHKLLKLAPRVFGRYMESEEVSLFAKTIQNSIDLAQSTGDYIPAVFLSNIVSLHGALPEEVRKSGVSLRASTLKNIAMMEKPIIERGIEYYKQILTDSDIKDIWQAYEEYQAELQLAREKGEQEQFIQDKTTDAAAAMESSMTEMGNVIEEIENADKLKGSLGQAAKKAMLGVVFSQELAVVTRNQAGVIDLPDADLHLIELPEETSANALKGVLSGLNGDELERQLLILELILLKSEKDYLGSQGDLVDIAWQRLEDGVNALGHQLPYSRGELRRNLRSILKEHNLLNRDQTIGLLAGN